MSTEATTASEPSRSSPSGSGAAAPAREPRQGLLGERARRPNMSTPGAASPRWAGPRSLLRVDRALARWTLHRRGRWSAETGSGGACAGATRAASAPLRSRAGRRTTTQLLAGTGVGAVRSTAGVAARSPPWAARRAVFGGMRRTTTGGGGAGLSLRAGSTAASAGAAGAGRAGRLGRRRRRALGRGTARSPSASRRLSRATFRTRPTRSATKAVTVASICVLMLMAPRLLESDTLVNGCRLDSRRRPVGRPSGPAPRPALSQTAARRCDRHRGRVC